jgi:hypothetical protein
VVSWEMHKDWLALLVPERTRLQDQTKYEVLEISSTVPSILHSIRVFPLKNRSTESGEGTSQKFGYLPVSRSELDRFAGVLVERLYGSA